MVGNVTEDQNELVRLINLLGQHEANFNSNTSVGTDVLWHAIREFDRGDDFTTFDSSVIEALVENGADINQEYRVDDDIADSRLLFRSSHTPLLLAAMRTRADYICHCGSWGLSRFSECAWRNVSNDSFRPRTCAGHHRSCEFRC